VRCRASPHEYRLVKLARNADGVVRAPPITLGKPALLTAIPPFTLRGSKLAQSVFILDGKRSNRFDISLRDPQVRLYRGERNLKLRIPKSQQEFPEG
jgi:hypothetical protein